MRRINKSTCAHQYVYDQDKYIWKRLFVDTLPDQHVGTEHNDHRERECCVSEAALGYLLIDGNIPLLLGPHNMWSVVCAIVFIRLSADILSCFLSFTSPF